VKTLSIIVTTLNSNGKIQGFLGSILNQDTRNFSIIIVDGGSTDGTIDTIRKCDLPIHLIVKPGISIYGGLNCAIEVCNADYYIVCGSDDELSVDAVSIILYDINHRVNSDLYLYSIKKGNSICKSYKPTPFRKILGWQSIVASHSVGCVIKKKLHEKLGYYSPKYKILADGYFLTKILNSGINIFVSKNILGTFSITGTSNKSYYENIFVTFLIQIKFKAFFPQLILLIARLIKYRNLAD
jgi:glycosyltransferase involved in cell wall biosynthesis